MIYVVSSFTGCLEFMPKYNITPLEGLDVCPFRHSVYIIFPSLGAMTRVSTALTTEVACGT